MRCTKADEPAAFLSVCWHLCYFCALPENIFRDTRTRNFLYWGEGGGEKKTTHCILNYGRAINDNPFFMAQEEVSLSQLGLSRSDER